MFISCVPLLLPLHSWHLHSWPSANSLLPGPDRSHWYIYCWSLVNESYTSSVLTWTVDLPIAHLLIGKNFLFRQSTVKINMTLIIKRCMWPLSASLSEVLSRHVFTALLTYQSTPPAVQLTRTAWALLRRVHVSGRQAGWQVSLSWAVQSAGPQLTETRRDHTARFPPEVLERERGGWGGGLAKTIFLKALFQTHL